MAQMRSVRFKYAALAILLLLVVGSCKRENRDGTGALTASLIFDNASPDVREALASSVDFRINDDNFARWKKRRGISRSCHARQSLLVLQPVVARSIGPSPVWNRAPTRGRR